MNDKQQLAAMGELMAEQPLCMAKRIEELEAQVLVMAGLLREVTRVVPAIGVAIDDLPVVDAFLDRIEAALAGNLPSQATPEGWQLVPVEATENMISESIDAGRFDEDDAVFFWVAMLAAAPKPDPKP